MLVLYNIHYIHMHRWYALLFRVFENRTLQQQGALAGWDILLFLLSLQWRHGDDDALNGHIMTMYYNKL